MLLGLNDNVLGNIVKIDFMKAFSEKAGFILVALIFGGGTEKIILDKESKKGVTLSDHCNSLVPCSFDCQKERTCYFLRNL